MEGVIREEIRRFVLESPDNRFPESDEPYFDEPLIAFGSANDPLFTAYKEIIGDFHLTPAEIMKSIYGEGAGEARTVICWVLPVTSATRESNRREEKVPSRRWALTRAYGERFNNQLRMYVVDMLRFVSAQAVAPLLSGMWRPEMDPKGGLSSTWSERHAAYAAGLGTFSLSDGFITERGIAHRCGSVLTDVGISPSPRNYADHLGNCLYFRDGSCGVCIRRCPAGAISLQGHDKERCKAYVYGELRGAVGELYGVMETGCGLCQTRVPCESCNPVGSGEDLTGKE
jgi:epoxyqueuosine reductase